MSADVVGPRAVVDVRGMDLEALRASLENRELLRTFGFEPRRLYVLSTEFEPRLLARQFVVLAAPDPRALSRFHTGAQPNQQTTPADFDQRPLVVIQSMTSTTIEAVWAHRPTRVHLLVDRSDDLAPFRAVWLRAALGVGVEVVEHGFSRSHATVGASIAAALAGVDKVNVNVVPGDKLARVALLRWVAEHPAQRCAFELEGAQVRPLEGGDPTAPRPVPLARLLTANVGLAVRESPRASPAWTRPLAEQMARMPHTERWSELKRSASPFVDVTTLELVLASTRLPFDPDLCANNVWFEQVLAALLPDDAELVTNANPQEELDVIARCGERASLWECKVGDIPISRTAWSVRTRADYYLGHRAIAVLVVPRLNDASAFSDGTRLAVGHWRFGDAPHAAHVVDARVLVDAARLAKLAAGGFDSLR